MNSVNADKIISVLYSNAHFDALTNIAGWFGGRNFCYACLKPYDKPGQHRCNVTCSRCFGSTHKTAVPSDPRDYLKCSDCRRSFLTPECFSNHLEKKFSGKALCSIIYFCSKCYEYYDGFRSTIYGGKHVCGKRVCRNCGDMVRILEHRCYMLTYAEQKAKQAKNQKKKKNADSSAADAAADVEPPPVKKALKQPHKIIFWDTEARQENDGMHEANLFIAHIVCEECIDAFDASNLHQFKRNECRHRHETRFECETVDEFGEFIMRQRNATCIAHNFKGYDSAFILDYCRKESVTPELIMTGSKCTYMYMPEQDVRFIDSCNFLPMPLAKFSDTFGFKELRKGHFPHFFNTVANKKYIGPLPSKDMYGYKTMRPEQRVEFDKWYDAEVKNKTVFNMEKDIVSYCDNDVAVLDRGCSQFRAMLRDIANTDPFREAITIASTAQLIFRKQFLKPKQIAVVPPNGYRPKVNQSSKALVWLTWLAKTRNMSIRDCRHPQGEFRIDKYTVDGYDAESNTVFEFLGSYWHGDLTVYSPHTYNSTVLCPMGILHDQTLARQREIEKRGYRYEAIWESTWDEMVKHNMDVREFVDSLDIALPLSPRDAFFGGRTNACQLYYIQPKDGGSKVHYVDFCSLYPTVNKYGKYPLGHPTIITNIAADNTSVDAYFGLCKCTLIPPKDLYHPVLPYRHPDGKLMFPLCIKCANTYNQKACTHTDEQRKWTGTWVTLELQHAVSRGYKIVRVHEVWHFEQSTVYDKRTGTGGLFADYVNMFIKIKQEASGLPPGVQTDTQIDAYIEDFFQREGVRLDKSMIKFNPGLRYVAKLFLNSLWGKFGQRSNLPVTEFVSSIKELHGLLQRTDIEVMNVQEFKGVRIEDDICQVQYRRKTDFVEESTSTNIFIAAFTTAQARLMLLREMEKLDQRVLYYDTDSIIYVSHDGDQEPQTGCFLGELTHELKPGEYITEFFSGGPKNYGYKTSFGKIVQKHKGITLNAHVLETLSFDSARSIVTDSAAKGVKSELQVPVHQIRRLPQGTGLKTVDTYKRYGFDYDKRVLVSNFNTLPYGHKDIY